MTWEKYGKTSILSAKRVDTSSGEFLDTSTPAENRLYTGFSEEKYQNSEKSNVQPDPTTGVDIIPEFLGAKKAAELLGIKQRSVNRNCDSGKYEGAKKALVDGVEVWQIPISSLPAHAQSMMREEAKAAALERVAVAILPLPTPQNMKFSPAEYSIIWEEYERSGANHIRYRTSSRSIEIIVNGEKRKGHGRQSTEDNT